MDYCASHTLVQPIWIGGESLKSKGDVEKKTNHNNYVCSFGFKLLKQYFDCFVLAGFSPLMVTYTKYQ